MSKLQKYIEQESLYRNEGATGVSNLCKIVAAIGYKDPFHQMQMSQGGKLGDLMVFLEDNPGAITAIIEWIDEHSERCAEWQEALDEELNPEDDEDEEDEDDEE